MIDTFVRSEALMGTVVSMQVVARDNSAAAHEHRTNSVRRAFDWFRHVEATCSRFEPASELQQLSARAGSAVTVSPLLFHAVKFACELARETNGAFDPTVGRRMELRGFNRHYRDDAVTDSGVDDAGASYRDILFDDDAMTITLCRPLLLDLGAVAKGLAVDMAARELTDLAHFAIDAGGDLYLSGYNADDAPWRVGIRHPHDTTSVIETLSVCDRAVCTSGDYEKRSATNGDALHLIDARSGASATSLASVTVLAPSAMVADALATAVFVLGPRDGAALLARHNVSALLITPSLERIAVGAVPSA